MAVYELSDFLFVCEKHPFFGIGGCGAEELVVEKARGIKDAAKRAEEQGWYACMPGPWDDPQQWKALCPACHTDLKAFKARIEARKAAAGA